MKKLLFYIGMIILSIQTACTPEPIPIDLPQAEQKLVIYSQVLPDQLLVVTLSKSFSALLIPADNDNPSDADSVNNAFLNQFLVENARVIVKGSDYNDTLIKATKGVYVAPLFPFSPGNTYELTAYDTITGLSVSSITTTLPIVEFDSISAIRQKGEDSLDVEVYFSIDDPAGDNYYLVNIYTDSIPENNFFSNNSEDLNSFSFSDKEFPNGKVNLTETIYVFGSDSMALTLTNISRDYFDYLQSRNRSESSFLSEPISFPTNVTNGYGYFNLHFPSSRFIEVD